MKIEKNIYAKYFLKKNGNIQDINIMKWNYKNMKR